MKIPTHHDGCASIDNHHVCDGETFLPCDCCLAKIAKHQTEHDYLFKQLAEKDRIIEDLRRAGLEAIALARQAVLGCQHAEHRAKLAEQEASDLHFLKQRIDCDRYYEWRRHQL